MQTGIISFCNRSAVNIKSESTKRFLLNKLENAFHTKIIKRHFDVEADEQSLSKIRTNPHIACLKSNGNPYFMFLTKIDDIDTCVMIDKKVQYGYFLPRMIIVRMRFDEDLFSDTLPRERSSRRSRKPSCENERDQARQPAPSLGRAKLRAARRPVQHSGQKVRRLFGNRRFGHQLRPYPTLHQSRHSVQTHVL